MSREKWDVRPLRPGDHIRVKYQSFYHHGLYEGDGMVIHFAGPDMQALMDPEQVIVRRDSLDAFSMDRHIEVRCYSLKEKLQKRSAEKILSAARESLGQRDYDILYNNCEHFVNRCIFGRAFSTQIDEMRKLIPDD